MNDGYDLPQTLVLAPELPFAEVHTALEALGFMREESSVVSEPIIVGEPELAAWSQSGALPIVHYTFNPVVRLRLLEVATVPPELRAAIARRLPPMPASAVADALHAGDDRQRLFGVWAAIETERLDLIQDIRAVHAAASGVLAEEAETALHRLSDLADSRLSMLTGARLVAEAATELLEALRDAAALAQLVPTRADCEALFHASIAEAVWRAVAARDAPRGGLRAPPQDAEAIVAAPAGAFRWPNELSSRFPQGYRVIAGWLEPSRIWLAWTGHEPDGGTRLMDGLVFANGRWVWLPKPWRLVEPVIGRLPDTCCPRGH